MEERCLSPENRSARPAQRRRGRNLPGFLNCSCSLDHPPEIILRLLTSASLRGRRSGLAIKLRTIQKRLREFRLRRQLCRRSWLHQAGSYHHEQFRIRLVLCPAFEEISKDRHVSKDRNLRSAFRQAVINQACDRETLPVSQFNLGARFPARERRYKE